MAVTVSQAYHSAIKDGISPQDFFLRDMDAPFNFLSASAGDFVAGTPTIRRSVCESTDMTLGECPSASLSVTLANPYGDAIEFWSQRGASITDKVVRAKAGIGVQTGKNIYTTTDKLRLDMNTGNDKIYVRDGKLVITADADVSIVDNKLIFGSDSGVTITNGKIVVTDADNISIWVDASGTLHLNSYTASGFSDAVSLHASHASDGYLVYIGMSDGTVKEMEVPSTVSAMPTITTLTGDDLPGGAMVRKLTEVQMTAVYDENGFPETVCTYSDGVCTEEHWEFCPVGVYYMTAPKYNLHSAVIEVTDAMDAMSLLDTNLKELADTNGISLNEDAAVIINAILTAKEIPHSTYTIIGSVPVSEEMITADITCRQFFKWVGERAGHMWVVNANGVLKKYVQPDFDAPYYDYTLTTEQLVAGYEVYNEYVDPPEKLVIYYGDDSVFTSQASVLTRDDYYKISGNPLYVDPDNDALTWLRYNTLPLKSYQIADCMTVSADPSFGYGDPMWIIDQENYKTYVMQETITFGIRAVAHYVATGSNTRIDTESKTYTGMMVGEVGDRVDQLPGVIADQTSGQISQALEDALAEGGAIAGAIGQATEGLISASDVQSEIDRLEQEILNANGVSQEIKDSIANLFNELHQYIEWSDANGLSIKAIDPETGLPSTTYLNLQNDILAFIYGGDAPAWMTANTFNINNLIVHESASIVGLIIQNVNISGTIHTRIS